MSALDQAYETVVAITTATVSSASVFFVMEKIEFPEAKLFAMLVFVVAMVKSWGNDQVSEA